MNTEKEWVYKNQQKVYINNDIRNEDKAYDYEMEAILAKLHTDNFNEDEYYELKYDRFYHQ
jgi:hypothetical protein